MAVNNLSSRAEKQRVFKCQNGQNGQDFYSSGISFDLCGRSAMGTHRWGTLL